MATKEQVSKLMGVMATGFPNYKLARETIVVYAELLADVDYTLLEAAAKQVMTENREFFPSLGHWRQTAFEIIEKAQQIPDAFAAWEEVMYKIGHRWTYDEPECSHPLIAQAVKIVSFTRLCNFSLDELSYERTNFYKVYESLLTRARDDVRMLPAVKEAAAKIASGVKQLTEGMKVNGNK